MVTQSTKEIIGIKKRSFKAWLINKLGGIPLNEMFRQEHIIYTTPIMPEKFMVEKIGIAIDQYGKRIMAKELVDKLIEEGFVEFIVNTDHITLECLPQFHTRAVLWAVKMQREDLLPGEHYV